MERLGCWGVGVVSDGIQFVDWWMFASKERSDTRDDSEGDFLCGGLMPPPVVGWGSCTFEVDGGEKNSVIVLEFVVVEWDREFFGLDFVLFLRLEVCCFDL